MHDLDHILWEEYSLAEGEERFLELTGIKPAFGGNHPELGTHNSLLSLGRGKYLELIAPNSEHPKMADWPKEPPPNFKSGLFAFVMRSLDLGLTEELVEQAGCEIKKRLEVGRSSELMQLYTRLQIECILFFKLMRRKCMLLYQHLKVK